MLNVIALLSTFKLQRSRWFRIGLENTFPGFFSQAFFHRFFVSGFTTVELVYVPPIVIVTITMYTISPTCFPMWGAVRSTLRRIVLYRVRLAGNKMAGRDGWSAPFHRLLCLHGKCFLFG